MIRYTSIVIIGDSVHQDREVAGLRNSGYEVDNDMEGAINVCGRANSLEEFLDALEDSLHPDCTIDDYAEAAVQ